MLEKFYSCAIPEVFKKLGSTKAGLSGEDARNRVAKFGLNRIPRKGKISWPFVLLSQLKSPLNYILFAAAIVSAALSEFVDMGIILAAIFINVLIGFIQENKAQNALAKLAEIITYKAHVVRDGQDKTINAEDLVPGDIIILESGSKIPADARLLEASALEVMEAALTGESQSEIKDVKKLKPDTHLGDRTNMVYSGTTIVGGHGKAVVTAVGLKTEIGKIASLIKETEEVKTPLQKKLAKFSRILGVAVIGVSALIFILGLLRGFGFEYMFITAVAVAVTAIPEGLVIATTVILAVGMQKILKKKALIRNLISAETLGSATVICTDKTGTLTRGEMQVSEIVTWNNNFDIEKKRDGSFNLPEKALDELHLSIRIGMLCNNAYVENPDEEFEKWKISGNLTERALLMAGLNMGLRQEKLLKASPKIDEIPFSSDKKYMVTLHKLNDNKNVLYLKGAPEKVVNMASKIMIGGQEEEFNNHKKEKFANYFENLSKKGLRLLALAYQKTSTDCEELETCFSDMENEFVFVGFVAIKDPLRPEVKETLEIAEQAGIKTVMITGDHKLTAQAIAKEMGMDVKAENIMEGDELEKLSDAQLLEKVEKIKVYARVSPEHKIKIVSAWQKKGEVVAMTGDGVNDSPALKKADIGIAVGSGTDVAKEIADMVILDDNFKSIIDAVKEGRGMFANIKKSITYILSNSFTEVILIGGSLLLGLPLPLTAAMILYINLFEDSFTDMALAFEPTDPDVMKEKAQGHKAKLFDKEVKTLIFLIGIITDLVLFGLFYYLLSTTNDEFYIRTVIFATLGMSSLIYVFSCKNLKKSILKIKVFDNKFLLGAMALGLAFILVALYVPFMQGILGTVHLGAMEWIIIIGFGLFDMFMIELTKYFFIHKKHHGKLSLKKHGAN